MPRPEFDVILKTIRDAYAKAGAGPCRGRWVDPYTGCICPGTALRLAKGLNCPPGQEGIAARQARSCLRELLGGTPPPFGTWGLIDSGFLAGYDGDEPEEDSPDYLWAYEVGRKVARALGVAGSAP